MPDRTGLLWAIGGMALWFIGPRAVSDWVAAFATLLMLATPGVGLAQLLRPPVAAYGLIAMSLSALVHVLHYVRNGRTGTEPYSGLALLLGLFWELLHRVFEQPTELLLSQTVVVVITALALTFWGHVAHRRSPLFCGLACMGLALAKVLLIDLVRLKSFNMLASGGSCRPRLHRGLRHPAPTCLIPWSRIPILPNGLLELDLRGEESRARQAHPRGAQHWRARKAQFQFEPSQARAVFETGGALS